MSNVTSAKMYPHEKLISRKLFFAKINFLKVISLTEKGRKYYNGVATNGSCHQISATKFCKYRRSIITIETCETCNYDVHVNTLPCYGPLRRFFVDFGRHLNLHEFKHWFYLHR